MSRSVVYYSDLKHFAKSASHFKHHISQVRAMTRSMRVGTVTDRLLTGGVMPGVWAGERRGKAWLEYRAAYEGDIVTEAEYAEGAAIADAVRTNPLAMQYLTGRPQVTLSWDMQGVQCATRGIDVVGEGWISDLKTTNTAEPEQLKRHARRMLWPAQLAFYREACRQNGISTEEGVFLVCIESKPPYPATVLRLTEEALADGERCIAQWIEQYKACEAAQVWPGYAQSVIPLEGWGEDVELTGFSEEDGDAVE